MLSGVGTASPVPGCLYGIRCTNNFYNLSKATMKIKNKLRTAAELTISATMIATLLAACGGGSGSGTAATVPGSNTVNVTPGKGKMTGATVEIWDANHNLLGSGPTLASGWPQLAFPVLQPARSSSR